MDESCCFCKRGHIHKINYNFDCDTSLLVDTVVLSIFKSIWVLWTNVRVCLSSFSTLFNVLPSKFAQMFLIILYMSQDCKKLWDLVMAAALGATLRMFLQFLETVACFFHTILYKHSCSSLVTIMKMKNPMLLFFGCFWVFWSTFSVFLMIL